MHTDIELIDTQKTEYIYYREDGWGRRHYSWRNMITRHQISYLVMADGTHRQSYFQPFFLILYSPRTSARAIRKMQAYSAKIILHIQFEGPPSTLLISKHLIL